MTKKQKVTDFRDAQVMRQMGLPLNTPVKDMGKLPDKASKAINDTLEAAITLRKTALACCYAAATGKPTQVEKKYYKAREAFDILHCALDDALKYVARCNQEAVKMIVFGTLEPRVGPMYDYWFDVFDKLDDGEGLEINSADLSRTLFPDTSKPFESLRWGRANEQSTE